MFESLQERLGSVFDGLTRKGVLKEADVDAALREVRVALLEADVALSVARDFVAEVREEALGEDVLRSVTPGQMVIKIVHDHLVTRLRGVIVDRPRIDLADLDGVLDDDLADSHLLGEDRDARGELRYMELA